MFFIYGYKYNEFYGERKTNIRSLKNKNRSFYNSAAPERYPRRLNQFFSSTKNFYYTNCCLYS